MTRPRGRRALEVASFFMADMQAGIGPFLGILLLAHGWHLGRIGTVMTIGALAGVTMTTPAGALVDRTRQKRTLILGLGVCTMIASGVVLATQEFWLVALSQVGTAIAGAAAGPGRHRDHAGSRPAAGLRAAERPEPGLQSCRKSGRRRAVRSPRPEARPRGRVLARGWIRRPLGRLGDAYSRRRDRQRRGAWPGRLGRGSEPMAHAPPEPCVARARDIASLFSSRQWRDVAAARNGDLRDEDDRSRSGGRDHDRRRTGRDGDRLGPRRALRGAHERMARPPRVSDEHPDRKSIRRSSTSTINPTMSATNGRSARHAAAICVTSASSDSSTSCIFGSSPHERRSQ